MKKQDIIYLAGIIDGEGSFYIGQDAKRERNFNSRIVIVNTDIKLIDWLHKTFGGLVYSRKSIKHPTWKRKYEWIINKSEILNISKAMLPYLIIKKEHAIVMIKFRKTFNKKRGRGIPVDDKTHQLRCTLMKELSKLNHNNIPT